MKTYLDTFEDYSNQIKKRLIELQVKHNFTLQQVISGYEMYKQMHPEFKESKQKIEMTQDTRTIIIPYELFEKIVLMKKDKNWNDVLEEWCGQHQET